MANGIGSVYFRQWDGWYYFKYHGKPVKLCHGSAGEIEAELKS